MVDFFSLKQPVKTPGRIIRAFRRNFGYTLAEIEKVTGIRQSNLSAMENESRPVGLDVAIRIGAFFGLDPTSILFPDGGMAAIETPEMKRITKASMLLAKRKKKKRAS